MKRIFSITTKCINYFSWNVYEKGETDEDFFSRLGYIWYTIFQMTTLREVVEVYSSSWMILFVAFVTLLTILIIDITLDGDKVNEYSIIYSVILINTYNFFITFFDDDTSLLLHEGSTHYCEIYFLGRSSLFRKFFYDAVVA